MFVVSGFAVCAVGGCCFCSVGRRSGVGKGSEDAPGRIWVASGVDLDGAVPRSAVKLTASLRRYGQLIPLDTVLYRLLISY